MQPNSNEDKSFLAYESDNSISSTRDLISKDTELFQHPIFSHEKDTILSNIINVMKFLIKPDPDTSFLQELNEYFIDLLIQKAFEGQETSSLSQELENFNRSRTTSCGKLIVPEEIFFRCLDCEDIETVSNSISLQCKECFEHSNHQGHRILRLKASIDDCSPTCDCGDPSFLNPKGFCPQHQLREMSIDEALKNFPKDIREKFQTTLSTAFYSVVSLFEIAERATNPKIKRALDFFAQLLAEKVFTFCLISYSEISSSFLPILEVMFQSNFQPPFNQVWHDCHTFNHNNKPATGDFVKHRTCTCSILGALFRMNIFFGGEIEALLHQIVVECIKESRFREFIVLEMVKYAHFIYAKTFLQEDGRANECSRLFDLNSHLYMREGLVLKVIQTKQFQNLIDMMSKIINESHEMNPETSSNIILLARDLYRLTHPNFSCVDILLKNTNFIQDFLKIMTTFQTKFFFKEKIEIGIFAHDIDDSIINLSVVTERVAWYALKNSFQRLKTYPEKEKSDIFGHITNFWYTCFKNSETVLDNKLKEGALSFNLVLERILGTMIISYLPEISNQGLEKFFNEFFPNFEQEKVASRVVRGILRALGMRRFIDILQNVFQTLGYYSLESGTFEQDITLLQMMIILIKPEDLFKTLYQNFFSYSQELIDFCNSHIPGLNEPRLK